MTGMLQPQLAILTTEPGRALEPRVPHIVLTQEATASAGNSRWSLRQLRVDWEKTDPQICRRRKAIHLNLP